MTSPRLPHIEVAGSSPCRELEDILKPLIHALERRRKLVLRCGEGSACALDSLSIIGCEVRPYKPILDDIPQTFIKHVFRETI